ncbi:terpenoid synthase, partial [Obba rivulosa]
MSPPDLDVLKVLSKSATWSHDNETALLEPFEHINSIPGKEIRGQMIDSFNKWLKVPSEKLGVISKVVSMLHTASLLIDDIEDDAQLRRGVPVSHKIYGIPQTINAANYVYFLAYQELFRLRSESNVWADNGREGKTRLIPPTELDRLVTAELLSLHRGQGLELLWRDSLSCPTEEEYIAMVNNKTGGLFRVAVKLMMACATTNVDVDYLPLVNMIGVYFQIRDDYMNLQSTEYADNKGFAEDLTEGKFSFPIVHAVRADASNKQVLNVLQKRPSTPTLKKYTIAYLQHHTKSFDYTVRILCTLEQQIRQEIARLGGNEGLEAIMDALQVKAERINRC